MLTSHSRAPPVSFMNIVLQHQVERQTVQLPRQILRVKLRLQVCCSRKLSQYRLCWFIHAGANPKSKATDPAATSTSTGSNTGNNNGGDSTNNINIKAGGASQTASNPTPIIVGVTVGLAVLSVLGISWWDFPSRNYMWVSVDLSFCKLAHVTKAKKPRSRIKRQWKSF